MINNDVLKNIAQRAKRRLIGKENVVNAKIKVISNEDEDFKSKVEFLLAQDEVVSNPVQYLIDNKAMKGMSSEAKERYLLNTLDKYSAFKQKLERENVCSRFCM